MADAHVTNTEIKELRKLADVFAGLGPESDALVNLASKLEARRKTRAEASAKRNREEIRRLRYE